MKRYLVCERASLGRIYDGMGLELWGCGEEEAWLGSFGLGTVSLSDDFDNGTFVGAVSNGGPNTLGMTLPYASSAGLAVYEATALLADILSAFPTPRAV
jgi:hypothetical protein